MNREAEGISPFTVSQWQELEHQALIYKYLIAGLPLPPDLVLSVQNSLSSSRFFQRPSYGYCSRENSLYGIGIGYGYGYGKKVDPEPGRCRRTDGKKWRCAKEAYPDSKYCERHMHRGRNRSRKPVESNSLSSSSSSSTSCSSISSLTLNQTQSLPLKFNAFASATTDASSIVNANQSQFEYDSIPYAIPTKQYSRHLQGFKPEANEHISFSQSSGGNKSLLIDSALDNTWPSPSPQLPSLTSSKHLDSSSLHNDYYRQSCNNSEFGTSRSGSQSLHPFFKAWPNSRDAWSGLENESANQGAFSTTQLSISVPMASSDFSTSPQSPQEH